MDYHFLKKETNERIFSYSCICRDSVEDISFLDKELGTIYKNLPERFYISDKGFDYLECFIVCKKNTLGNFGYFTAKK